MTEIILDLIEHHPSGMVMVRSILRQEGANDEYIRQTLEPGQDVSSQPEEVQAACATAWTDEAIAAWSEKLRQVPPTPMES